MNPRRAPTVLVFHTSFRSSWNEMQDGLHRYAHARKWNVFVAEHELDRKTIEDLLAFWRPDGVIVEGAMDEKGLFRHRCGSSHAASRAVSPLFMDI